MNKDRKRNQDARKFLIQRARRLKQRINVMYHMQDVTNEVIQRANIQVQLPLLSSSCSK